MLRHSEVSASLVDRCQILRGVPLRMTAICWLAVFGVTTLISATSLAQSTAPVSPFDQDDPEIAKIKSLDWKDANFGALTSNQQAEALMALNKALSTIGTKASTRADLLVDYIDQHELGPAYAAAKQTIPDPPAVTYDQMKRLAAAYVLSAEGSAKVAGSFEGDSTSMISQYTALYDKSARRLFEEASESRFQVRSMGLFLQEQDKLGDFRVWAPEEQKRRDEQLAQEQSQQHAEKQQAREERAQAYNEQRQAQQERAAQQMEAALAQQQQQASASSGSSSQSDSGYYNDGWLGYGYPVTGAYWGYYNSNAYRGYVKDKVQNAYDRWGNRPRPTPMPAQRPAFRGGGGGFRGGGRR